MKPENKLNHSRQIKTPSVLCRTSTIDIFIENKTPYINTHTYAHDVQEEKKLKTKNENVI